MWIAIEHAPKDRPVDLWVATSVGGYRVADAVWGRYVNFLVHGDIRLRDGWTYYLGHQDDWVNVEDSDRRVTHYMLIPEGPNGNE